MLSYVMLCYMLFFHIDSDSEDIGNGMSLLDMQFFTIMEIDFASLISFSW